MAIGNEAAHHENCVECGRPLPTEVLQSGAGYYIGCFCPVDGPNNRESGYYSTRKAAEEDLANWPYLINARI